MTWRDQIEACTNAANTSAVWKYLKLTEKDAKSITSTKHRQRETASHVSDEKRLMLVTTMIEIAKSPQMISK